MTPVIYTIAKNEAHNVAGFMAAAEGAAVYVLDTGSEDETVNLLKQHGAFVVQQKIIPWRFDHARRAALDLVPNNEDILCLSLDMDERLESGWQEKISVEWLAECNFGNYRYIGEWQDAGCTVPATESARTRIHARRGFHWTRAVHEVLEPDQGVRVKPCNTSILVRHYSDGKQRDYSPLLTSILEANPADADARLQRGGEFVQKTEWENALVDYQAWLRLSHQDDRPITRYRRASAFIAMAACYHHLGQNERCLRALFEAVAAEPLCREAWVHLGHAHKTIGDCAMALACAQKALRIKNAPYFAAIDHFCWSDYPDELAKEMHKALQEAPPL